MTKILYNGEQRIACEDLAYYIKQGYFVDIYLVLKVQNPAFAPLVICLTAFSNDGFVDEVHEYIAERIGYASEGDRFMDVDVQGQQLYLNCGQHPPFPMTEYPYIKVCPHCTKPSMSMVEFRQGQGDDEQSWYTCDNCSTEVYINVTSFDEEE